MGDGAELLWKLQAGAPELLPERDADQVPVPPMFIGLSSFQSDWWALAWCQAMDPEGHPEEPPCPHCQYFGGEEHHPCCPRTMHYTAHPDGTVTEAGFACEVCGVPAGVPCDGGFHG